MSKLNQQPRGFNTKFRTVTVVHPSIRDKSQMSGTKFDYTEIPAISARGSWVLMDMLSDASIRNTLDVYNVLKGKERQYSK